MKLKICCVVFLLVSVIMTCLADDAEEDDEDRPRSCQKYIYDFVMGILNATLKCLSGQSTFKMNSIFELITRTGCLLKCTLQEDGGVIGPEDGRFDDISAALFFEASFPQQVRELILPEAQACFSLADNFNPKEYWCKSYIPFVECTFKALLKGLIPFGGECISNPIIGILFAVFKNLTPDSYDVNEAMDELKRAVVNKDPIKCLNANCTRMYEHKKINGTKSIIVYNENKEVISVETRKTKKKEKEQQQPPPQTSNSNVYSYNSYQYGKYQNPYLQKYNNN